MKFWKFKAYDSSMRFREGFIKENTPEMAALKLRQRGLQIVDMHTVTKKEYVNAAKMQRMKGITQNPSAIVQNDKTSLIHSMWRKLTSLFRHNTTHI